MRRLGEHRLWSTETLNEVIGIDDRYVSARGHRSLFVWDHRDGRLVDGVDARSITCGDPSRIAVDVGDRHHVKVSADGRWVAAANYGPRLRVFDNATGAMKFADDPEYDYSSVAYSPDGTMIVATAGAAYVWSAGADMPRRVAGVHHSARLDAEGDVVGGRKGMVGRWSLDGTERARISLRGKIEALSFSDDARYGAVTTYDTHGLCGWSLPDVVVADLARGRAILRFHDAVDDPARVAVLSPNARWLHLLDDTGIRLMPATPRPAWSTPPIVARWEPLSSFAVSGDDRAAIVRDNVLQIVTIPSCEVLASVQVPDETFPTWSPDGRLLLERSPDQCHIRMRSLRDLNVVAEQSFEHSIRAFALSPDGTRIAVTDDATIIEVEIAPLR